MPAAKRETSRVIYPTRWIRRYRLISQLPASVNYALLSQDDFSEFCSMLAVEPNGYGSGFALIADGEILELWGFAGIVPYLSKFVTLLYSSAIHESIDHTYFSIGEQCKTRRYPKNLLTFRRRVYQWLSHNVGDKHLSDQDIARYSTIAAFNFGWVNVSALDWQSIERESLWLER